jgi:hypothetical protein
MLERQTAVVVALQKLGFDSRAVGVATEAADTEAQDDEVVVKVSR